MVTRAPRCDQSLRHLLEVALGSAALGIVRVAPAEEGDVTPGEVVVVSHRPEPYRRVTCRLRSAGADEDPTVARRPVAVAAPVPGVRPRAVRPGAVLHRAGARLRAAARSYHDLSGQLMLDVGGGPGYFRDAFEAEGATYVALDADVGELAGAGRSTAGPSSAAAWSCRSPTARSTSATPPTSSSTCPSRGGWPPRWCGSPGPAAWSSSATPPGSAPGAGTRPRRGTTSAGVARGAATPRSTVTSPRTSTASRSSRSPSQTGCDGRATQQVADVVHLVPRYNPWWSRWLLHVPVVREVVTWNLVLVLRRR